MVQNFKGDELELNIQAAGTPAFDSCSLALDEFFEGCYESGDFLLSLYDEGRMPFSDRVPRDSFVAFIKQAIPNFPVTGTFDSYLFIIQAVFGAGSGVLFEVPAAGKLNMLINSSTSIDFDFQAREFSNGEYNYFDILTSSGDGLGFKGISGIDSEAKLNQLLSELIPAGVFTSITLTFFTLFQWVSTGGDLMVDNLGNQIVFFQLGE